MAQIPNGSDLAALIEEHRIGILSAWIDALFELREAHYRDYAPDTVRAWAATGLRAAAGALQGQTPGALPGRLPGPAEEVSRVLSAHGFTIEQVIEGLLLLRQVVEPFLRRVYGREPQQMAGAMQVWDAGQRRLLGTVAQAFAAEMLRNLERARARTASMLAAAETAGGSLDLTTVYERTASMLAAALPVDFCAVFEGDERAETFWHQTSVGHLPEERLQPILTRPLRPAIDPLVRRTLEAPYRGPQQARYKDPFLGQTTCRALHLASACLIPIATPDRVQALVLCVTTEENSTPADAIEEQLELAWGIAKTVAPAVGNARLHAETERQLQVSRSLQGVSDAVLGRQSADDILALICEQARALMDCTGTAVYETTGPEELAGSAEVARAGAIPDAFPGALSSLVSPGLPGKKAGDPPTGMASDTAGDITLDPASDMVGAMAGAMVPDTEPITLNGLEQHPVLGPRTPIHALMLLRLRVGGELVGALLLVDRQRDFTPSDARLVRLFADQAALALERARMLAQQEQLALAEERQRLARDLHDSISQSLYGLTMYAEAAARHLKGGAVAKAVASLEVLRDTSLDALREMRLLIFDLRPTVLSEEGLEPALRSRLSSVEQRCGLQTELRAEGIGALPRRVAEALYGMACEALGNTLKHAQATQVRVRLRQDEDGLELEITDDGVGFDPEEGWRSGGYGLRSLRERAEAIEATLTVDTRSGGGTRVRVRVPVAELGSPQ